jgi:hypothetical protein
MMTDVGREPGFGPQISGDLGQALRREWLGTNGIGGYDGSTIAGCQTRRYRGLLVAAMLPRVGRSARLADLDVEAQLLNHRYELACHEYTAGTIEPRGYVLIESFRLDGTVPTWTCALGSRRRRGARDLTLLCEPYSILKGIVDCYRRETRRGISVDPQDPLSSTI